jgi:hypothetical protein
MKTKKQTSLYYPKELFDASSRWHIFPLLKSLLKEENAKTELFLIVNTIQKANCVIIPMSWNYYYRCNTIKQVLDYYKTIPSNKRVISFVFGDKGVRVPRKFKGLVFRTSGFRSKLPKNHIGMPVFIEDPLKKHYSQSTIVQKPYALKALVGFCGQARPFGLHNIKEYCKITLKNSLTLIGYSKRDVEPIVSAAYLRIQILNYLKASHNVTCNFIIRKAYRAGITTQKDTHPSTLEFYDNIVSSDYIVCVRGAGNFSTRFYETLAMGRIPVFVNTDCLLPLSQIIDWKQHVVWVEYNDRHAIGEIISAFHKRQDEAALNNVFLKNRALWEQHLQLYSFFNTFFEKDKNHI